MARQSAIREVAATSAVETDADVAPLTATAVLSDAKVVETLAVRVDSVTALLSVETRAVEMVMVDVDTEDKEFETVVTRPSMTVSRLVARTISEDKPVDTVLVKLLTELVSEDTKVARESVATSAVDRVMSALLSAVASDDTEFKRTSVLEAAEEMAAVETDRDEASVETKVTRASTAFSRLVARTISELRLPETEAA